MAKPSGVKSGARRGAGEDGWAESLFERLHPAMAWLAALFVLVVVGETIVAHETPFATIFTVCGWAIWGIFVLEFFLRASLAGDIRAFLQANWWQLIFLALPFVALLRFFMAFRVARAGRLVSAVVRGGRSAAASLRSRLATVAASTVLIVLIAANVLYEFGNLRPYAAALHDSAMATITGEPISGSSGVKEVMDVVLAPYSVAVFAAVAGTLGAYFLEQERGSRPGRLSDLPTASGGVS